MADAELDELARAMPRTTAANARADVDLNRLKEYIDAAQDTATQRMSVAVRADVRKDADGFEDIDDFWADDDEAGDKDDTEGDESSMLSESVASSANVSMLSTASEIEVNLSDMHSDDDDNTGAAMDLHVNVNTRPRSRDHSGDTMELESLHNQHDDDETVAMTKETSDASAPVLTPRKRYSRSQSSDERKSPERSAPASPDFDMDGNASYGRASTTPPSSAKKAALLATPAKSKSRSSSPALSSGSKAAQKKKLKLRRESREFSFGEPNGFDNNNVSSPFSIQDAVLTPLSNASEKNLPSIKPFSDNGSGDSPNIRVELFKKSKKASADAWDGDNHVTKRKKPKASATKHKELSTPKPKQKKTKYKSTPTSDLSFEGERTDNDDGSFTANNTSGMGSDDNDSDWDKDKSMELSRVRNGREGDLSYADEILKDAQGNDADGLRRSKRKRFKPLAWYKGEHYVYERRQSGVGLVIPTVAGIERAGTTTPLKKKLAPRKGVISRPRTTKPLPRDKLPEGLTIENGEWADLWDISVCALNTMNVVCRSNEIEQRELPNVDDLPAGYAGQSFNLRNPTPFARWICGRLGLPPGAAKEAESVGDAVQVFFVMGCQPQSLEVALGPAQDGFFNPKTATRFLLNPNDEFYIPAQNAYYLKNHSETATSELHFMILKPDARDAAASAGSSRRAQDTDERDVEETLPRPRKRAKVPQEI